MPVIDEDASTDPNDYECTAEACEGTAEEFCFRCDTPVCHLHVEMFKAEPFCHECALLMEKRGEQIQQVVAVGSWMTVEMHRSDVA